MAKTRDLTQGNIKKTIISMTLPMILGMLGMVAFNFADTAFVGQLGGVQLAALTFTFPVILIIQSVAHGIGIGTASIIARSAAKRNVVRRIATDGLMLSVIMVIIFVTIGMLTMRPLFRGMGAADAEMQYITQYMTVWYFGVPMVVIPIMGNNIIRALGDTKVPGLVMLISAGVNVVLDPLLIFGIGPFPQMGVVGAALATVIARFLSLCVALYILTHREHLISFKGFSLRVFWGSVKRILHIGIPSTVTKAIVPIGSYIITGFLAAYGTSVVAGYGAGVKTEFVVMSVLIALGTVIISFAGQNYGAGQIARLKTGFQFAHAATAVYGLAAYALLFFTAPYIATIFNADALIQQTTVLYIRIAVAALLFQGGAQIVTSAYNAVGKPFHAAFLSLLQMFGLYIPLALLLPRLMGQAGIFVALAVSYAVTSVIGYAMFMRFLNKKQAIRADLVSESPGD